MKTPTFSKMHQVSAVPTLYRSVQWQALGLLMALWIASCKPASHSDASKVSSEDIVVKMAPVVTGQAALPVLTSGLISSETQARYSFKIGGMIEKIYVSEGDAIQAGQLLATLNLTEINAQVIQARNGVEKAQRDLERVKNLFADSVATLEQVQNLGTQLNLAQEGLRIASFNQAYAQIRATTSGKVVRKLMNEGELASPGMPVFFVNATQQGQWVLKAGISDRDWARISLGDSARLELDAYPGQSFSGQVSRLAEGADPVTGSYQVEIRLHPTSFKLAGGLFGKASITPSHTHKLAFIPIEAISEGNGKKAFVFVPNGQKQVKKIPIEIAYILEKQVAVSSGLEQVQQVITAGSGYLNENSTIISH
jgi:multidrug efflux system membrane fusion protein